MSNDDIRKNVPARVIQFSPPDISELEINEVAEALRSGWITTGPRTKELERRLAEYCHTSKTVCLNSATAAEELNFRICGIEPGDEVIVPAYTYTASASAPIHCGAKVVFVDSQKDNCEMDYDKVAEAITEKTKVVVAVDLGGIICDYDKLYAAIESKKHLFKAKEGNSLGARIQQAIGRVMVFADCAHALGANKEGKMAGEWADFTSFSFHAVKNFTTAEGGASTWKDIEGIDNEEIYKQFQLYSLHGQSKDALAKTQLGAWEYDIIGPWYKCNMTDIMAAIGLRQLDRYPGMLERRKEIVAKYDAMCDELGVKHLVHSGENFNSSHHLYLTRIPGISDETRREIIIKLAERGVNTNVHYKPLPMMTAYKAMGWDVKDFPNAYAYYENLITLPLHTKLSDEDVEYVIENYKEVVFIGNPTGKIKQLLDAQGVVFTSKITTPASLLYIIDASQALSANTRKEIQKHLLKGADIWLWGLVPETINEYNEILPLPVTLDRLKRSSFLPIQKSWMRGLNNSDFYFCELQKADACDYSLKGTLVEEGEVLLNACKTDWRQWNKRPEEIKTAGTIRSEYECTAATPVFVKYQHGPSTFYLNTLTEFANSEKGYNTLSAILKNAGITYIKPEININEVFFLRDEQVNFPVTANEKLTKDGDSWVLEFHVFSPRPLDDLLIEPNMPKLSLMLKAKKRELFINNKPYNSVSHNGQNEIIYKELPLLQGWNKLVIKIGAEDRNDFSGFFKCDNKKDFLPLLKAAFINPETK